MSDLSKLAAKLCHPSSNVFYTALSELRGAILRNTDGALEFLLTVASALSGERLLSQREKSIRFDAILGRFTLSESDITRLANSARAFPPELKNTVAQQLAPHERQLIYQDDLVQTRDRPSDESGPASPVSVSQETVSLTSPPLATVLLLSCISQAANRSLLSKSGFQPMQWNTLAKVIQDLRSNVDICACLLDSSFLNQLSEDEQRLLFRNLGIYSTIIWIRIDRNGLKISGDEVRRILMSERCQRIPIASHSLSFQPDGILHERELSDIERPRSYLGTINTAQLFPGEITDEQSRVLLAATRQHIQELSYADITVSVLETKFLSAGRSPAKIALVRPNREGKYLVAKIDDKERIINEVKRFRHFIEPWDDSLRPEPCFHGEAAIILFGLISEEGDGLTPAPMLEDSLQDLWKQEAFSNISTTTDYDIMFRSRNLEEGLSNLAKRLAALNSQTPADSNFEAWGNPKMEDYSSLDSIVFEDRLLRARRIATERFKTLWQNSIVHGDVQLRNVLVRGYRDMHVIDYAYSGPGHPALDLVRLELALYLSCFKQFEHESRYVELQKALSLDMLDFHGVKRSFPEFSAISVNRVCLSGMLAARNEALKVLNIHGGNARDYIATKYVVAWQALFTSGLQTGLALSILYGLADDMLHW